MAKYLNKIIARFKRQEQKGLNKYGQILEDNPRGYIEALEYLAEELTDGLMYVQEAIVKLKLETYRTPKETELQSRRAEELIIKLENEIDTLHKENNAHQQCIQGLLGQVTTYQEIIQKVRNMAMNSEVRGQKTTTEQCAIMNELLNICSDREQRGALNEVY